MNITFRIRFSTHPGQSLWLAGEPPLPAHPVPMTCVNAEHWEITVPLTARAADATLNYSYVLAQADGSRSTDWGRDRTLTPAAYGESDLLVLDSWNHAGYVENVFYTEPFKEVLMAKNHTAVKVADPTRPTHTFRAKAPLLDRHQTLCLLGESPALGHWDTQRPILLGRQPGEDYFSVSLDLRGQPFPLAYKYGVYDVEKKAFLRFEDGLDRRLPEAAGPDRRTVINDGFVRLPLKPWRGAGVAVPLFSLRSEHSFGVGEFADLKLLADWGQKTGLKLIQLLPINDTSATGTWKDSYPYAAISAFALHPIYLNLAEVVTAKNRKLLQALEPERQRLNALDALDYEAVMKVKLAFLRRIFPSQKAVTFRSQDYLKFFAENRHWLVPYAAFCHLRDQFGTADFGQWPEHQRFDEQAIAALASNNDDVAFYYFLQYHLHVQLQEATAHIHAAGLILKGDLAIGVYRYGADAWQAPELYHLELQAGAPPDAFSATGQNWGFPTYNWPRMAEDGFAWWKQRFAQMANYFDAFRVDHILGFFRIWSNPSHAVEGILGHFEPALPVEPGELTARGIYVERDRLTRPFINDAVLRETFGDAAGEVRREFLLPAGGGTYSLKPEFATQQQVKNHFAARSEGRKDAARAAGDLPPEETIKSGLFRLISNVILLEAEGKLHFRFGMEETSSFKHLPAEAQPGLRQLYVDYFFRRQDDFWMREAMQKLPALKRVTDMLICGEDLGLVPACVPVVMSDLGLLSLEIQRMPKTLGAEFSRPASAPYLSVVTPSTHDMSTIRGWWEEDRELTQKFFNRELGLAGEAPRVAEPWIVETVIRQHLASPAMWSIIQWQDLLGVDGALRRADVAAERVNVPAIPNYYWRYRLHLGLERMLQAEDFNSRLRQLVEESGR
jgi:4-alpha-glucanotransferase